MKHIFAEYKVINIMPDYGGAYLWGHDECVAQVGENIADSLWGVDKTLPISEALQLQFHQWQRQFEGISFCGEAYEESMNNPSTQLAIVRNWKGETVFWDWAQFHAEGLRLAHCLKQEIDEQEIDEYCKLYYVKAHEDINANTEVFEILHDGNVRLLIVE